MTKIYTTTMTNYLMIENGGELDSSSLILLGASTKRNDNSKIGFFGSGNKYAIATLIRENVPFRIFSGEREVSISTEDVNFRDVNFKKILVDGHPTSLTTDMGPEWKEWMAIREWVSNSIDEGDSIINRNHNTDVIGKQGTTRFYVQHVPTIKQVVDNWNNMFAYDRTDVLFSNSKGKIYSQTKKDESMLLFRKGIRAYDSNETKSLFQYDIDGFHINESRLIDNLYAAGYKITELLLSCDNANVIRKIVQTCTFRDDTSNFLYFESSLDYKWKARGLLSSGVSEEWVKVLKERPLVVDALADFYPDVINKPHYKLSANLAVMAKEVLDIDVYGLNSDGKEFAYKAAVVNQRMQTLLDDSLEFLKKADYNVDYPIEIVEFNKTNTLGRAHDKKILLSEKVFKLGRKEITSTIIEENEHLKTGFADCTREFQNHFITLFITEMENKCGHYL